MAVSRPTRPGIIVPALRRSLIGLVFGVLATAPVLAENVPLPIPAPLPKTSGAHTTSPAAPVPPAPVPNANAQDDSHQSSIFPFSLPFGRNSSNSSSSSDQASNFDAKQRSLLDRISMYLSSIQTMEGHFVQIGPDGGRTEGNFYIQKPGRVRFAYDPPSPIDIIADGSSVVVRDRKLATQDLYPLSQTPLRYLLADRIDLLHDTDVVSVSSDETFATVVIEQKQVLVGTARLMLMFDAKNLMLKQWTVTDPQGLDTTVAVYNLDSTKKPDPNLFVINYQRDQGGVQ
ncbi:MAG TPA: outer membrane lipoprotein carrier protein LolA [Xanthobacteraceae bacterium]|nr:outer membrane lipoprotein carrier protein LolA [Xanthobacteraceae bacterium]